MVTVVNIGVCCCWLWLIVLWCLRVDVGWCCWVLVGVVLFSWW